MADPSIFGIDFKNKMAWVWIIKKEAVVRNSTNVHASTEVEDMIIFDNFHDFNLLPM